MNPNEASALDAGSKDIFFQGVIKLAGNDGVPGEIVF